MINSALRERIKGITLKVDPKARTSNSFLGDDLNTSLLAFITLMSLKHYSKSIKVIEMKIILGNVFLKKYKLDNFIAEALTNSPLLSEKSAESLVFLESAGLVKVDGDQEKIISLTENGDSFLKTTQKTHSSLVRKMKLLITLLKKEGLAFS